MKQRLCMLDQYQHSKLVVKYDKKGASALFFHTPT
jgi:hypothetical protein